VKDVIPLFLTIFIYKETFEDMLSV
jgi:hypothetical protein